MAMGIVSDEELEAELNRLNNHKSADIINMPSRGRSNGDGNVPEVLRKIIGENAIEEGNKETQTLSRALGISDSSVSAYKNGATSTDSYHTPHSDLKQHVDNKKIVIASKAKSRLLKAINHITDEKLRDAKPTDLASIARNLSGVVKDMEPDTPKSSNGGNGPTFLVYAPQIRKEESYDVIHLNEG